MVSSPRIRIEAAADTDQGLERHLNQDAVYVWTSSPEIEPPRALLIVADGMGGHQEGGIASQLAVDKILEILPAELESKKINDDALELLMTQAVQGANEAINNFAVDNEIDPHDIGTTLECVVVDGTYAYIVHIGDSRVYLLGKDGLKLITRDHTAIAEMVDAGILDQEEIYTHPQRNILTQALGGNLLSEIEVSKFKLSIGERILVCSDGLWGMVRDPALERILLWASPPHILVDELIVAANQAGGQDNISVVVCDILPG